MNISLKGGTLMNPYKALERVGWRFGAGKPFTPNSNDIDAYNSLVEFMENYQRREIMDNKLFAKLYIHVFTKFLIYYGASPDDPIPQKELHRIVSRPFSALFEELLDVITMADLEKAPEKPCRWGMEDIRYNMNMQISKAIEEWK